MIEKNSRFLPACHSLLRLTAILLALVVSPISTMGEQPEQAPAKRRFRDIGDDMDAFLKAESQAESVPERIATIRDLCALYTELSHDPRLQNSATLQEYQTKVWRRLRKLTVEFDRILKQQKYQQDREARKQQQSDTPASFNDSGTRLPTAAALMSDQLGEQMMLVNSVSGGPANIVVRSSGSWGGGDSTGCSGGGAIADHAAELIELIHTVVSPSVWDVNGGNATIRYYRPVHALVIRATSEVHEDIGGAMEALRRAAR